MFTGLIEETGTLARRDRRGPGFRLDVATKLGPLEMGESIAVNGACLTVVDIRQGVVGFDVSVETVERTTLGDAALGGHLNLERALRVGDRLGGHYVSGHVDGVGVVGEVTREGEALRVRVAVPEALMAFMAPKGSVCLDGVSLTINRTFTDAIELMLIPHTVAVTNLDGISPGRRLNVEVDILARYVASQLVHLAQSGTPSGGNDTLLGALRRSGFLAE